MTTNFLVQTTSADSVPAVNVEVTIAADLPGMPRDEAVLEIFKAAGLFNKFCSVRTSMNIRVDTSNVYVFAVLYKDSGELVTGHAIEL